jgi:hypothetical protein
MVINESKEHVVYMLKVEVVIPGASPTTLKKEAAGSFETVLTFYQFAWCQSVETQFSPLLHVDVNAKRDSCVQKQNIYTHTCGCPPTHTHTLARAHTSTHVHAPMRARAHTHTTSCITFNMFRTLYAH